MKPELHPACSEWPKFSQPELIALAEDIKRQGQLEDITLTIDGLLLDGSNRWDACELAGLEPRTTIYEGDDPVGFVISKNKLRRHLEAGHLAMITARLVELKPHRPAEITTSVRRTYPKSAKQLADDVGISHSTLDRARTVLKHGADNVIAMVEKGEVPVSVAADALLDRKTKAEQTAWTPKM